MNNPALNGEVSCKEKMLLQINLKLKRANGAFDGFDSSISNTPEKTVKLLGLPFRKKTVIIQFQIHNLKELNVGEGNFSHGLNTNVFLPLVL